MKKIDSITIVLLFALILFSTILLSSFKSKDNSPKIIPQENEVINYTKEDSIRDEIERWNQYKLQNYNDFLDAIGYQESRNRYHIVNKYGYMGKYQFGKSTLKTLKIKVSQSEFLRDSVLQEQAMFALLKYNKKRLKKLIDKYDGQIVHGIFVTESGLLAAAHLGGQGSVKKWFRSGKIKRDGNGVKITSYMKKFGGYYLCL
jgi:hypothetical protein|tara:strand:+ start:101 stop:706 length:606 start_codon:yes stop_codon:yes gene_type:complete